MSCGRLLFHASSFDGQKKKPWKKQLRCCFRVEHSAFDGQNRRRRCLKGNCEKIKVFLVIHFSFGGVALVQIFSFVDIFVVKYTPLTTRLQLVATFK